MNKIILYLGMILFLYMTAPYPVDAHRSGCHRWHSCPSDSGSYTCGDAGYPCQYPTYPSSGGVIYPKSGYYRDCYQCPLKKVPLNASTPSTGVGFTCDPGYIKSGITCKKIFVPLNAHLNITNSGWDCDSGFQRVGKECWKIYVPANAHINWTGSGWDCDSGFQRVGKECIPY
jgi:hypothetical protein